jgi:hypothetical protein
MKQTHTEVRKTFTTTSRQDSTLLGHQDVLGGRLSLLLMATQQSNLRVVSLTCVLIYAKQSPRTLQYFSRSCHNFTMCRMSSSHPLTIVVKVSPIRSFQIDAIQDYDILSSRCAGAYQSSCLKTR